jgi:quercetin dioxygenase-like cupin family protein
MLVHDLRAAARFDADTRVEDVLLSIAGGDFTCACWEPGQISPYHCHPFATEAYLCLDGGGVMRTPFAEVEVVPGSFVVHPPDELHEFENGAQRSVLYRVRYGPDLSARTIGWRGRRGWQPDALDAAYLREHPAFAGLAVEMFSGDADGGQ